ncbi:MAG: MBL fold metallo-hydrolase [Lachnospiraceae bacterium]|nr:MBL fold metallo-hydrolase [Lachnospiraceae bacterium]
MSKKKKAIILVIILACVLVIGAGIALALILPKITKPAPTETETEEEVRTGLGPHSEFDIFLNVPPMTREDVVYTDAEEVGGGDYLITAENTTMDDYRDYLSVLEKEGFRKVYDNGEQGLEGFVYTADYQKDDLWVIVSYIVNLKRMNITATEKTVLSDRLKRDESAETKAKDAKTSLHLYEFESVGMGFFFQLKNGHFILFDGGTKVELPHMLSYMQTLVPEGEIPVIDAWFITHAHSDHMGFLSGFSENRNYVNRVAIESIYYCDPAEKADVINGGADGVTWNLKYCNTASDFVLASDGTHPELYRTRLGERYYFDGLTADVIYTPELSPAEEWDTFNSASIVVMVTVEDQKVLVTADADWSSQLIYTEMYDKDYFNLAVYQAPHHGINVYRQITNRLGTIDTVFYPAQVVSGGAGPASFTGRKPQNAHLMSLAEESFAAGDGTRILTFPYEVGSSELLPKKFNLEQ